jgi:hypothetical protein
VSAEIGATVSAVTGQVVTGHAAIVPVETGPVASAQVQSDRDRTAGTGALGPVASVLATQTVATVVALDPSAVAARTSRRRQNCRSAPRRSV